jgi:DNA-binding transcriptional ArsR family regulator
VNQATPAAPVFAALGDETRLRLVARLSNEGPLSIAQLTQGGPVTRRAVTKHLHVLSDAGIAHSRSRGRERIWELEPEALLEARAYLEEVSARWDGVLARLQQFVEGEESEVNSRASERSGGHEHTKGRLPEPFGP